MHWSSLECGLVYPMFVACDLTSRTWLGNQWRTWQRLCWGRVSVEKEFQSVGAKIRGAGLISIRLVFCSVIIWDRDELKLTWSVLCWAGRIYDTLFEYGEQRLRKGRFNVVCERASWIWRREGRIYETFFEYIEQRLWKSNLNVVCERTSWMWCG